jgi:hypothetical protein
LLSVSFPIPTLPITTPTCALPRFPIMNFIISPIIKLIVLKKSSSFAPIYFILFVFFLEFN